MTLATLKLYLNDYQQFCSEGSVYPGANTKETCELSYLALGLAGETGEAVDVIKKIVRLDTHIDRHPDLKDKLVGELGDVYWYFTRLLDTLDVSLEDVIAQNWDKLEGRITSGTVKLRSGE